jgi:prevent-host-death family protein
MGVKKIAARSFKVHCLAVMDEVQAKRETVVITKRGKPVAKLVPVEEQTDDLFGFLRGKVTIVGDVVSPPLKLGEWGNLA